jgi:PadR family transcriptional regulator PadR
MRDMTAANGLTELRRGVLGPCVLALLESKPRFGLELVRDLAAADGLLTSDGTVYPLLNRRYYSITEAGRQSLVAFRSEWGQFSEAVAGVLNHAREPSGDGEKGRVP